MCEPRMAYFSSSQGELLLLLTISATDKQWSRSEGKLRKMLDTFRA